MKVHPKSVHLAMKVLLPHVDNLVIERPFQDCIDGVFISGDGYERQYWHFISVEWEDGMTQYPEPCVEVPANKICAEHLGLQAFFRDNGMDWVGPKKLVGFICNSDKRRFEDDTDDWSDDCKVICPVRLIK